MQYRILPAVTRLLSTAAVLTSLLPSPAQFLVDPSMPAGREVIELFGQKWTARDAEELKCRVTHFAPWLDFGLRVWTGYSAELPASQFDLHGHERLIVLMRVMPRAAPEGVKYFWMRFDVPEAPSEIATQKKVFLNLGGGFLAGNGGYSADWLAIDSKGRRARTSWRINVKLDRAEMRSPPNTVEPLEVESWQGFPDAREARASRAVIFIHATAVWPRRYVTRLSPLDRHILISTLSSLLRNTQFGSASVVVYNLRRREVLFRDPSFGKDGMRDLAARLSSADLGTISIDTLQHGPSPEAFLEGLLRKELAHSSANDAFVFIGSAWRAGPKLWHMPPNLRESAPKSYALAFAPPVVPLDDSVSSLVRSLNGHVFAISSPTDLLNSLRAIAAGK